jgi:hypothetical protein
VVPIGVTSVLVVWWPPRRIFPECGEPFRLKLLPDHLVEFYNVDYARVDGTQIGPKISAARITVHRPWQQPGADRKLNGGGLGRFSDQNRDYEKSNAWCSELEKRDRDVQRAGPGIDGVGGGGDWHRPYSFVLTELEPGQRYRFFVNAGNRNGLSPE